MKAYRVALLRKEFPFLDRLLLDWQGRCDPPMEDVDRIYIRRGDQNLLSLVGNEDSYEWSRGGHYNYRLYFAVTRADSGWSVVRLETSGRSATGSGKHNEWTALPNGEQLFLEGIVPDFIVECVQNDTDDNGNGKVIRVWTIYKMAKFDLASYHTAGIDAAAAALKAEIAAACS